MSAVAETRPRPAGRRKFKRARTALSIPSKAAYALGLRSTKALCLPDFLIIGSAKAGTTWIAENLDFHPEVYLARRPGVRDPTEVRYFSQSFQKPLSYYSDLFLPGRDKVKGDKSPSYCTISSFRIRFIRSVMPAVRIFLFVRNPVERAWSHTVMNLVKFDGRKVEDIPASQFHRFFERSKEQGLYTRIIERWSNVFSKEQLFVGFYDDIRADPIGLLSRACAHIGVSTNVDFNGFPCRSVVNRGLGVAMPAEHRRYLEEMFRDEIARLEELFGSSVTRWRSSSDVSLRASS